MKLVQDTLHDRFTKVVTRTVIRSMIAVCIVLSAFALSIAQKTDQDPLNRVITELQAGRMEQAYAALDEVIKQYPNHADAYLMRGSLKMQADPAQALSDFNKVIELKPDWGVAYNQRAIMRLVNNDSPGALKDLDAAIAHDFSDDSVYYMRSHLRWQAGELNGSLSDLNEAIKLNPNNPRLYSSRGELLIALKQPDRGLADLNYLINWYETDPTARPVPKRTDQNDAKSQSQPAEARKNDSKGFTIGIAQETTNDAPGSKEMAPTIARTYVNRGSLLSSRGNNVGAQADFDKAIRIEPTNVSALYLRANEYEHKGDLPAALADIIKALQNEPKNGNLMVEQGVILLLMGKEKEAQAVFDVLLKSDQALWQKRIDDRTAAMRKVVPVK